MLLKGMFTPRAQGHLQICFFFVYLFGNQSGKIFGNQSGKIFGNQFGKLPKVSTTACDPSFSISMSMFDRTIPTPPPKYGFAPSPGPVAIFIG